jgi:quercetin dioxygenase-like cupin family protein
VTERVVHVDDIMCETFLSDPPQQRAFKVLLSPTLQDGAPGGVSVGTADVYPRQTTPRHVHDDSYEVWYCLKGSGYVVAGDLRVLLKRGQVVSCPPGVPHHLENPHVDSHFKCVVLFTPAGPEKMFIRTAGDSGETA